MKKIFILVLCLFICINISAYDVNILSQLTPEQQVDLWIEEFKNYEHYNQKLSFMRTISYFTLQENVPAIKRVMIQRLSNFELLPLNLVPRTFDMISYVLYSDFYYDLSSDEKKLISIIIQNKLNDYVFKRKEIDVTVIYYSCLIKRLQSDEKMTPKPEDEDPQIIFEYYRTLGYNDIQIAWDEIEQRYGIER